MCGICGKFSPGGVAPEEILRMLGLIAHRGPDDEGLYVGEHIGLGNRRLSIIDLPGGKQPISNEDGTIWIVYNGEIYNYPELAVELAGQGHRFRTQSDTEVIVHLYEELGEACVERLNGMFAFAIWDDRQQKLFMARDRLGQKPLFYALDGENFLFASEIKSILAVRDTQPEMNLVAIHHYLSLRFIPPPATMIQGVYKLPPAHTLVYQNGQTRITRFWNLSFREKLGMSDAEFMDGLRHQLIKSVARHMISDVPVGAFLSGGLDSSMIVAIMTRELGLSFKTFAIGVTEQDFDETPFARQVAYHCQTQHHDEQVQADIIHSLPDMIWYLDEPSDPIAACMYHAAALAARHIKVVLGGDGGDELFAGFDRYAGLQRLGFYTRLPASLRRGLVAPALDHLSDSFSYKNLTQKLRWGNQLSLIPDKGRRYAEATSFFRFNEPGKQALYHPDLWQTLGHLDSAEVIASQYHAADSTEPLDRMLYADYMTRLPEHSLMLTDRMTMAHGLENRSPFLDHELVEYLATFPGRLKVRGGTTKVILRQLAQEYLPPAIVRRDKQGFMFPVAYWFRGPLHNYLRESLMDSHFVHAGLFRQEQISNLLEEHRTSRVDHHVRLWMLLNLDIWYDMVIKQNRKEYAR
jgi:asparagine synthase (glutamine-hydrolysing)